VIGLGSIGSRVAALASGLGMHVTGMRRRLDQPAVPGVSAILGPEQLLEALAAADVVVLTVPRTHETKALIGRAELAAMKPTALLINVARGKLVDEAALVEALSTRMIGGAGLDAFQREPLPSDHPLWEMPNTLITPHTASFAGDYWEPVVDLFLENLARFKRGDALLNVVNKSLGY
jgi:phosphoglycerate dehydrogenase-like enzyme